ncbi:MAG TPA: hypothetical protein DCP91_07550, partial [Eggerthellaceae bacterium]|nr:hypothetical protein [Eggerthellaceae bacterium]
GLAGDPAFTPVVESSDASVGTADAQFVSNAGSSSVWKLTANVTNDWCTFDAFVDQNGKTYAADENGSVLVKVDQDGMRITARFKSAVDPLYNETDAESVTVAFTLSNDGVPLAGMDATPLARVEESIPYFDLSLYGLERYYRYHTAYGWGGYSDSQVVKRPTALHAYIWLAERYYLGLPAEDCGKGTSGIMSFKDDTLVSYFDATAAYRSGRLPAIVATQDPTSLYLSNFWGHDQNLMYYVNHAFPLMSKGVGATCDYVLLEDGDCIDMGLFSWWDFRLNGGFCQFDQDRYDINRGDKLDVRTLQASTLATADGSPAAPDAISTLKVALYDSNWNKVADLEGEGTYSYTFAQPGTYWLLATDPSAKDPNAACFAPAVAKVEVAGAPDRDENGTWLLGSADDMAWFQEWVNVKGHYDANAAITADIDMTSVEWTGLGETVGALYGLEALDGIRVDKAFAGVLDGRGHTLTVAFSAEPLCTLLTGTVKDLTITGTCSAPAAFTSCMSFGARLLNCVNQADVTGALPVGQSGERASAGIAVMVKDAYRVSMTEDTAMRIEGCVNKGSVSSSGNRAAGILGSVGSGMAGFKTTWGNMLTISGCSNEGVVSVADSRNGCVAGVVGTNSVQDCIVLENCSNAGEIVGGDANSAAGIVAHSETAIEQVISHCVNTGNITGAASYAGGILARGNGSASLIENCCNAGTISGHNAGGISSSNFSEIKNCYNLGDVKGSLTAGGIAAMHMGWQVPDTWSYIGAPVANCYTTGTVSGEGDVGAVFGKLYERGWEEAGYYSGTDYANVSAFWREGAAEAAIGAIGNACERFDTCEMRTAEQMHADAFAAELGDSFQTSCPYPVFAWQEAVDHSWDEGVVAIEPTLVSEGQRVFTCTVCGQTRAEVVPVADTSAIEEAIAAAKGIDASQLGEEQQQALAAAIAVAEAAAANNATTGSQLASALSSLELQAAKAEAAIAKAEAAAAQAAQAAAEKELEDAARAACEAAGTSYDEGKTPAENAAAAQSALAKAAADATAAQKAAETRADAAEKAAASGLKANTISVKAKTVKAKAKKKTVAKKAKAFVVKNAKGKVRFYKVKGHAKILVKQNGKVVVKKGLKAGKTYKVKVLVVAAGDKSHAPATKIVTCKVKVSKK